MLEVVPVVCVMEAAVMPLPACTMTSPLVGVRVTAAVPALIT